MKTSANIIMMIAVAALLAACDGAEPPTLREDPEDSFNGRLLEDDSTERLSDDWVLFIRRFKF